ncbi:serine/threonine-protein kinase [Amycolatopsis pigmentata]|uniref:non-specific serine/threonine protein kinase n=1 Tax=Amycolatopsis pigmentata TaxID=450801 RepID=A0ABW5FJF3_9PSEU
MDGLVGRYLVGRYRLVDPIASGGMGSVWRVWDAQARRYVAAKLLRPADAVSLLRFVREQSLRVEHPHVAAPTGWAAEDDQVLLTMDLVRGGTVAHLLSDYGTLPLSYVAVLIDQLLDALAAVHAHGIVHRDVKPSNLLLEPTGRGKPMLRLADFGIAVVMDEPRFTHSQVIGSPGYVAPERMLHVDPEPRQDLYAVGVLTARLLTGQATAVDRTGELPGSVRAFVEALSSESPANRPESAEAARREWRTAVEQAGAEPIGPAGLGTIEVFERLSPLPSGFGPDGPVSGSPDPEATNVLDTAAISAAAPAPLSRTRPDDDTGPRRPARAGLGRPVVITVGVVALVLAIGIPVTLFLRDADSIQGSAQPQQPVVESSASTTMSTTTASSSSPAPVPPPGSPVTTAPPTPAAGATTSVVVRTVVPVDDSFSVSTTDKCGVVDFVDHGQGASGSAAQDSVVVHDTCADGHGVKAWVKLDGTALGSRYNGNSQAGAPVTWYPFTTLTAGQRITLSVCLVDGSSGNAPARCGERTVTLVDG